jgi:hypothetical protein
MSRGGATARPEGVHVAVTAAPGSWGGHRPSLAPYFRVTEATSRVTARRRALMLTTLPGTCPRRRRCARPWRSATRPSAARTAGKACARSSRRSRRGLGRAGERGGMPSAASAAVLRGSVYLGDPASSSAAKPASSGVSSRARRTPNGCYTDPSRSVLDATQN